MAKDSERNSDQVWDSPGISNEKFDRLLDDIIGNTVVQIETIGTDNIISTIYMALYDPNIKLKNWGSVGILEYPQETDDQISIFTAAGKMVVESGQVPIAAFWLKQGRMEASNKDGKTSYEGFLILGMTEDFRVNGAFIPVEDGESKQAIPFYASNMNYRNTMDVDYLYYIFKSAKKEYMGTRDKGYVSPDTDELTRQLFKNAGGQGWSNDKEQE